MSRFRLRDQNPRLSVQAFTLVELLIVIGIIALLIGILLPSLAGARRASQRTACAAKLHQIMIAAQLHRNDHADYYPLAGLIPGTQPQDLEDAYSRKYDYFSATATGAGMATRQICPITTSLETEMASNAALFSNLGILNVSGEAGRETVMLQPQGLTSYFLCPAQASSPLDIIPQFVFLYVSTGGGVSLMEPQSYIFNEHVFGWNDKYGNLRGKASLIHQPAVTFFAADGLGGSFLANHEGAGGIPHGLFTLYNNSTALTPITMADAYRAPQGLGKNGIAGDLQNFDTKRHRGKINIAFCDGHVESRTISAGDLNSAFISAP